MYTLSIENIVTWALLKRPEGINIPFLKDLSYRINPYIKEGYVDIESKSLWALLDWSDMFKYDEENDNKIVFRDNYKDKLKDIEDKLIYRLPSYLAKLYYDLDYGWIDQNKEEIVLAKLSEDLEIRKQQNSRGVNMNKNKLFINEVLKKYNTAFSGSTQEYINTLYEKDFQNLLYAMCKTKYPELNELWFRIDERETYIELVYKNSVE